METTDVWNYIGLLGIQFVNKSPIANTTVW